MDHVMCGLAANPALPADLVDRLIEGADADICLSLADRDDLGHTQALTLAARCETTAVPLARAGRLTATDIDPVARPLAALALLDEKAGIPRWARLLAADPVVVHREKLAACPGLPPDVVETLAADRTYAWSPNSLCGRRPAWRPGSPGTRMRKSAARWRPTSRRRRPFWRR